MYVRTCKNGIEQKSIEPIISFWTEYNRKSRPARKGNTFVRVEVFGIDCSFCWKKGLFHPIGYRSSTFFRWNKYYATPCDVFWETGLLERNLDFLGLKVCCRVKKPLGRTTNSYGRSMIYQGDSLGICFAQHRVIRGFKKRNFCISKYIMLRKQ